jgi:uncharacterized protein (TIGR00159 family)
MVNGFYWLFGVSFLPEFNQPWWIQGLDLGLVITLTFLVLLAVNDRRTLWMVRGLIVLMVAAVVSEKYQLLLLTFVLDKMAIGGALAMSIGFQSELRRFLEHLGQGNIVTLIRPSRRISDTADNAIEQIVDAVKELSQKRVGALMIVETNGTVDERDFAVPGVRLDADLSKELIQTIFQTSTPLHDGAIFIRGNRIISAGTILPLSDRATSRQLGTRHRAAMGISERVNNCVCVVVSEETGSISLAERGTLDRLLTSNKLKELLEQKLGDADERENVSPTFKSLRRKFTSRTIGSISKILSRKERKR